MPTDQKNNNAKAKRLSALAAKPKDFSMLSYAGSIMLARFTPDFVLKDRPRINFITMELRHEFV